MTSTATLSQTLDGFTIQETLYEDSIGKAVVFLGCFSDKKDEQAIVKLTRRPFDTKDAHRMMKAISFREQLFENDVYSKFAAVMSEEDSLVNLDLTYPATEKHINKARAQQFVMVRESPEAYAAVTKPFIEAIPTSRLCWVRNILNKSAEAERMMFEDTDPRLGFVLHPDLKWDQKTLGDLYCIAICHTEDVRSLRDLNTSHLPLLLNIRDKACKAIEDKYQVKQESLRIFIHYQPSYYHFHVHFQHLSLSGSAGASVGKAHLLDDIIDNIKVFGGDFYQRRTLMYSLGTKDPLLDGFRKRKACSVENPES